MFQLLELCFVFIVFTSIYSNSVQTLDFDDINAEVYKPSFQHPNLEYYETLKLSHFKLHIVGGEVQHRNKKISFNALGRDFNLILNPQKGLLHSQIKVNAVNGVGNERSIKVDHENFYKGRVLGEMTSDVSAHLDGGVMTATIHTPHETFHIEPSWRHFPDASKDEMIMYRGSDIKHTQQDSKSGNKKEENDTIELDNLDISKVRTKRHQAGLHTFTTNKTRCSLLLIADFRFFKEMGGSNVQTTVNYLISLIDRVNRIYENTVWKKGPDDIGFTGMGFVIKKIIIHEEWTPVVADQLHYNMQKDSWDVRDLLEVFSREPSNYDYCLKHLFTDMKFEKGILGFSYVGSARRNSVGGICTAEYFKNGHVLHLNSGLSTSRNYFGQRVMTREADLVTAHEFGHNWGSVEDPSTAECSPSASEGGPYVMHPHPLPGYDVNNKLFSPCSIRSIRAVLVTKSQRCFTEPEVAYCGNHVIEEQEECDAGVKGQENIDSCCDMHCKLRPKALCSDSNSPCCSNCHYTSANVKCSEEQSVTCELASSCTGTSAACPKARSMSDGTPCSDKGQCHNGQCRPYCETQGLESCMCNSSLDTCKRCCRKMLNDACIPAKTNDILPNGTPCLKGFCNEGECEEIVEDEVVSFWDLIEDTNSNSRGRLTQNQGLLNLFMVFILNALCSGYILSFPRTT